MLFMKKLAKCSAAMMTNTSGDAFFNALLNREYPASRREYRSGSALSLRAVMPGPWLQTPQKTRLIWQQPTETRARAAAHRRAPRVHAPLPYGPPVGSIPVRRVFRIACEVEVRSVFAR